MPSQAHSNFLDRMSEIDQLLEAHEALDRIHRAEGSLQAGPKTLEEGVAVVGHLVSAPGPGRPSQVQALNKAAIALLSAHLQGFVEDLFEEAANALLGGTVQDISTLIDEAPTRGNPNRHNIERLFGSIGFPSILDGMSWQKMGNDAVLNRLRELNELRNRIVHGSTETVTKQVVRNYASFSRNFAARLDDRLRQRVHQVNGSYPW